MLKVTKKLAESCVREKYADARILGHKLLGKGWHGASYMVRFLRKGRAEMLILRIKNNIGFSHDYAPDRAASFLLNHLQANQLPNHARSLNVIGVGGGNVVSVGSCTEFVQVMEAAKGVSYSEDLKAILGKGAITKSDRGKALLLSNYLAALHKHKCNETAGAMASLYRRHVRDCIGHGEMLMGVLDTYPEKMAFSDDAELSGILLKSARHWGKIRHLSRKVCRIHGDFHPGNIFFDKNKLALLDASREIYGDPSDDVTSMAINYIWHAIMQKGAFEGPFRELCDLFWGNYMSKTKDDVINTIAPLFFAFRGIVVAHPLFYPRQPDETRRKILNFVHAVLDAGRFDYDEIGRYLG